MGNPLRRGDSGIPRRYRDHDGLRVVGFVATLRRHLARRNKHKCPDLFGIR